jgi:hypothetical protein
MGLVCAVCPGGGTGRMQPRQAGGWGSQGGRAPDERCRTRPVHDDLTGASPALRLPSVSAALGSLSTVRGEARRLCPSAGAPPVRAPMHQPRSGALGRHPRGRGWSQAQARPACLKHLRAAQRLSQPLARRALAWTDEATAGEAPTCPEPRYPTGSLPGRCALRRSKTADHRHQPRPDKPVQATVSDQTQLSRATLTLLCAVPRADASRARPTGTGHPHTSTP